MKTNKILAPRNGGEKTVEGRGYEPNEAVRCLNTNCYDDCMIEGVITDDDDTITCGDY